MGPKEVKCSFLDLNQLFKISPCQDLLTFSLKVKVSGLMSWPKALVAISRAKGPSSPCTEALGIQAVAMKSRSFKLKTPPRVTTKAATNLTLKNR